MTGSGISIPSSKIGFSFRQIVSPVIESFNPVTAITSPAPASSMSSLLFANILRTLPILSVFLRRGLYITVPGFNFPEYILMYES